MSYNITQLANSATASDLVCFANSTTTGVLLGMLMIGLFFIFLFALKSRYEFDDSLLASSWVCFVLSAILAYGKCSDGTHFLNIIFPLAFLCIAAFTGLYIWVAKRF